MARKPVPLTAEKLARWLQNRKAAHALAFNKGKFSTVQATDWKLLSNDWKAITRRLAADLLPLLAADVRAGRRALDAKEDEA